jgi:hypothetical protein
MDDVAAEERWSVVFRSWNYALLEAAEKMERSKPRRRAPFHYYLDEEDISVIAEDRLVEGDLFARGIAEAWQS